MYIKQTSWEADKHGQVHLNNVRASEARTKRTAQSHTNFFIPNFEFASHVIQISYEKKEMFLIHM